MLTIFVSLFAKFWPAIVGACGIGAGVLVGFVQTKSAQTKVAQANAVVAQAQQQVADEGNAQAQADAAAARAGETAVVNASQAEQAASTTPPSDLDARLEDLGALRKE
ncbi:hypothetical protein AB3X91_03675 [Paraburkholderia sp. BR14263]|uniref:hypothetical protein n=1 Tax=unclassified Paraburkholderia TaxID=2615204 RepID=UPI0034CD9AF1